MATPRDIDLQGLGLTGRRKLLPPPLPPKYDLGMRRAPVEPAGMAPIAGLTPASTGTIKPDFGAGLGLGSDGGSAPGQRGEVPEGLDPVKMEDSFYGRRVAELKGPWGLAYGANTAMGGPTGTVATVPAHILSGIVKDYVVPPVKEYIVDPIKNALGLAPKTEPVVPGWESPHFGNEPTRSGDGDGYSPDTSPAESVGQGWDSSHFGTESGVGGSITDADPDDGWF